MTRWNINLMYTIVMDRWRASACWRKTWQDESWSLQFRYFCWEPTLDNLFSTANGDRLAVRDWNLQWFCVKAIWHSGSFSKKEMLSFQVSFLSPMPFVLSSSFFLESWWLRLCRTAIWTVSYLFLFSVILCIHYLFFSKTSGSGRTAKNKDTHIKTWWWITIYMWSLRMKSICQPQKWIKTKNASHRIICSLIITIHVSLSSFIL